MNSVKKPNILEYVVVTLLIVTGTVLFNSTTQSVFIFSIMFFLAITVMGFLFNPVFINSLLKHKNFDYLIWFIVFFVFVALHYKNIHWHGDPFSFRRRMRIWLPALLVVLWLVRINDEDLLEFFGKCCVMASIPVILIILLTNDLYEVIGAGERFGDVETGMNGNMIALCMLFLIFFSFILLQKCPRWKVFTIFVIILMAAMLVLTGCRRAILALFVFFIIYLLLYGDRKRRALNVLFGLSVVGIVFYLFINVSFLYDIIGFRLLKMFNDIGLISLSGNVDVTDYSAELRKEFVPLALAMFKDKPLLGNGYAFFITHNGLNTAIQGYSTHNNYLEILVNYGVVGFIIYYSIIFFILVKLFKFRKQDRLIGFFFVFLLVHLVIVEPTTVNFPDYSIFYILYYICYRVVVNQKNNCSI